MYTVKLKKLDLSFMSMSNIILVSSKVRYGGRIGYPKKHVGDLEEVLKELDIHFFEDELGEEKVPITLSISEDHFKLYKRALNIKSEDPEESIRTFGNFYGYPSCCIEQYIEDLRNGDYSILRYWEQILESKKSLGLFAIFHVPCNPECEESKLLDYKFVKKLTEIDKEIARGYIDGKKSNLAHSLAIHADYYANQRK